MRVLLAILHMLVGLVAIAFVAGAVIWAWPTVVGVVRPAAIVAAVLLVATTAFRIVRKEAPDG